MLPYKQGNIAKHCHLGKVPSQTFMLRHLIFAGKETRGLGPFCFHSVPVPLLAKTTWQQVLKENWICILSKLREHTGFIYKYQILKTILKIALVLSKINSWEVYFINSLEWQNLHQFKSSQLSFPLRGDRTLTCSCGGWVRKGDLVQPPWRGIQEN